MSDELLSYYERELAYLRKQGAEFAERHPKIASRLRISGDSTEDPHIERLQQGVAFLNARLRKKLDDEFPEISEGMLGHLYPHYLAPIPSMAIVQFQPATDLTERRIVPAFAEIVSEAVQGERCRFRTTQPAEVLPVRIESVALSGRPLIGPAKPDGSMGVLRLTLKTQSKTIGWDKLQPDRLRFFLRGPSNDALRLYELILNDVSRVRSVVIADSADDHHPLVLDASAIQPVGFEADEGMIPYPPRSSKGYRLLTEYFAFPEKFLFFDIKGIANKTSQLIGESLDIFIYVDRWSTDLERAATKDSLALGCTPIVNLFTQRAEPIALSDTSVEYRIIPDSRRPGALEVYSVDKVSITSQAGENITLHPLFGLTHAAASRGETRFWHATRRPSGDGCSDTFLSLVDLDGDPFSPSDWVASIEATCTNRDLAGKLPFGGGHPNLRLNREQPGVGVISCLVAPRAPLRLPNRKQSTWRLISHLTLNHLSLIDQETGPAALREILRLYDFRDAAETRAMIDSMTGIEFSRGTARTPSRQMGVLCRGLDITMQFDDQLVSGVGVFLFASVLERFIAHYASINAFTRLTAKVKGRSGVLRTWPPRAGDLQNSLIDALRRDPERFELMQAVRILERVAVLDAEQGRSANAARVGGDADPRDEAVLLRATLELAFPASEVTGYDDSGTHRVVDASVLGLIGPSGVLPAHYSELVLAASRGKNVAMVDFLDMLNHRALSFLVRATEKYRPQMLFELTGGDASDAFSAALYGLIGLFDPTLRGRQAAPDTTLAFYAGHYAHRPRTAGALASLLSEYFENDIRVLQFQGSWSSLDVQEQSRLRQGLGSFSQLGVDAVCGSMIYDVQNGFRLVLGPLDWEQFVAFMPGTPRMAELIALTRSFADVANLFDVQLMLKGDQIPPLQLSRSTAPGGRVGWNTWLPSTGPRSDALDAVFHTCD